MTLQKGFNSAATWSETRTAQVRLLDSMARDLHNATTVATASGSMPLTLTITGRYSAYEASGNSAGEPGAASTFLPMQVSGTNGKLVNPAPDITVIYEQSGNFVNRRLKQSGVTNDAIRTISVFSGGVSISFANISGTTFISGVDNTIVPKVSATVGAILKTPITNVMTDTVFLRNSVYK